MYKRLLKISVAVGVLFFPALLIAQSRPLSYKALMFNADGRSPGYNLETLKQWLDDYITQLPEQEQPIFEQARANLGLSIKSRERRASELSSDKTMKEWFGVIRRYRPQSLLETNPFMLPQLQEARIILIGEDHTYHYPAEQLTEQLIAYNKAAAQDQKITHLFVEFSYQANVAMQYIQTHWQDKDMDEHTLLKNAVTYSKEILGEHYIPATLREEVRWLRLGYRLLQENSGVHFYAYDKPSRSIKARNDIARTFMQAVYQQPNTKAVFIGGALHMLRVNIPTPIFGLVGAQDSLANIATIPEDQIVSIIAVGGKQWKEDTQLYGGEAGRLELYDVLLFFYREKKGNWAFKTDPSKFGFDYYFVYDQSGVPMVTDANQW